MNPFDRAEALAAYAAMSKLEQEELDRIYNAEMIARVEAMAEEATRLPAWFPWVAFVAFVAALVFSAIYPWGFA